MEQFEKTRKLIALKRHEAPEDSYFDGFLVEFHQRQRAEMLRRSATGLFCERVSTYLAGSHPRRWAIAASVVVPIAIVSLTVFRPWAGSGLSQPNQPAPGPSKDRFLMPVSLDTSAVLMDTEGTFDHIQLMPATEFLRPDSLLEED